MPLVSARELEGAEAPRWRGGQVGRSTGSPIHRCSTSEMRTGLSKPGSVRVPGNLLGGAVFPSGQFPARVAVRGGLRQIRPTAADW